MFRLLLFCVLVVISGASEHGCRESDDRGHSAIPNLAQDPVVRTPSGTIRGSWLFTRRGRPVQAFRGIPYAEPPTGELRFQPPKPITQYNMEVDATKDGPACPQPTFGDYFVDEDCLRINVYVPGKISKPLPVIVFMHAGGFYSISGRSDVAGPNYLLDRDVVLVTINYRLASLGFLSTGDRHAPGNNGFKDQVAALRWVQRNVAAFGGNPDAVTISGYSAGSFSVQLHMVSPMSKGLFHRAISMSGSPISQVKLPHHQKELAIKQAHVLNCPTDTSKAILDCLRTKSSKELGDSLDQMFQFGYDPVLLWVPIIEEDFGQERFLIEHPLESLQKGKMHAVPYIVSQTQDEFFWKAFNILANESLIHIMDTEWHRIAPISFYLSEPSRNAADALRHYYLGNGPLVNNTEIAKKLGWLYNDAIIGFGVHTLANAMAVYSPQPMYYYQFAYIGNHSHYEDPVTKKPTGAAHHDDLIYLFSINASFPMIEVSDSRDSKMVDRMTAIFYNFARYGNPNPQPDTPELAFTWPRMTHTERKYLHIAKEFSIREKMYEERFKVWQELYNPKGCAYCI